MLFLLAHYLIFLSMVHELNMHISYKYIWKSVYFVHFGGGFHSRTLWADLTPFEK